MNQNSIPTRARASILLLLALFGGLALARPPAWSQDALSADAAVGRVLDAEGVVARRPLLAPRWRGIPGRLALDTGDWLRTGTRGANALRLALAGGAELTLGPGGLLELSSGSSVVLTRGELAYELSEEVGLAVTGPDGATLEVLGQGVLRARDGKLERLSAKPGWLEGYEANASTEALGSLLCEVDGRNVPLSMGEHLVGVDVRDGIARTVIEETFLNRTDTVLEGVFYFPLPADASISGFGMWVGGELVQGEIVEKERAREIYETILREKRDPGLLEWAGGNLFKARVYPIGREKRIRISYTQVLPAREGVRTYSYGLESDLLRQHPLSRLRLDVRVHSSDPLVNVESTTHAGRMRVGEHAASFEFEAEEHSPERDFELRIETAARPGSVTLVSHRRGDEGYFMARVHPPELSERSVEQSGPLEVLIVADTSGSMHGTPRDHQLTFVEALLTALGEEDRVQLVTSDVETRWAFEQARANSRKTREEALAFLEARDALGWSDLESTFEEVCSRASEQTQVIYVGDGVPTSGDPEPQAFAQRLSELHRGNGSFHAVVPGSSSEMIVLRAMAALGGGSVRVLGSDPTGGAFDLLEELSAPALKDVRVEFEGLDVYGVLPTQLANVALGREHTVLGRFDPRSGVRAGRVRVSAMLEGRRIEFESELRLDPEEEQTSFIPRLWARRQLDHLLGQGASQKIRERVIALSEDYQVITPYTSFLVLESDADRERFALKRGMRMRDGEEFFAQGREASRHELLRDQMLAAKGWRKRMRERLLLALEDMERGRTEVLREGGRNHGMDSVRGLRALGYAGEADSSFLKSAVPPTESLQMDFESQGEELALEEESMRGPGDSVPSSSASDDFFLGRRESSAAAKRQRAGGGPSSPGPLAFRDGRAAGALRSNVYGRPRDPFSGLFPSVPEPLQAREPWSGDERIEALLADLDRSAWLEASSGGLALELATRSTDPRGREHGARAWQLLSKHDWVAVSSHSPGGSPLRSWLRGDQRGTLNEGWGLGRTRAEQAGDARSWTALLSGQFGGLLDGYHEHEVTLEDLDEGRVALVARPRDPKAGGVRHVIDRARGLVLETSWTWKGEDQGKLVLRESQEVGGRSWPRSLERFDGEGELVSTLTYTVQVLDAVEYSARVARELAVLDGAILLGEPDADLQAAKQALRSGTGDLAQRWQVLLHFASTQRWNLADPHLEAFSEEVEGRFGLGAVRASYALAARRHDELADVLRTSARALVARERTGELEVADWIGYLTGQVQHGQQALDLLSELEPVYVRRADVHGARLRFDRLVAQALENAGHTLRAFEAWRAMAASYPDDVDVQLQYARRLAPRGELDQALELLESVELEGGPWQDHERARLRTGRIDLLWNGYRLEQLVTTFAAWEAEADAAVEQGAPNRLLSALVMLDRELEADARMADWLALLESEDLSQFDLHRAHAAVQHLLGRGYALYHQVTFEPLRAQRLAAVVRALKAHPDRSWLAASIVSDRNFLRTDAGRALQGELQAELEAGVETLELARLQNLVQWLRNAERLVASEAEERALWEALFERVHTRWRSLSLEEGRGLRQLLLSHAGDELALRVLRRDLELSEEGPSRAQAARELMGRLLAGEWSEAAETESLGLLVRMRQPQDGASTATRELERNRRIVALHDLVGWLLEGRGEAAVRSLPEFGSMSRRILASERARARKAARILLAGRLANLESELEDDVLAPFVRLERLHLTLRAKAEGAPEREAAFELLASLAETWSTGEIPERARVAARRAAATCILLVTRNPEDAQLAQRLTDFLSAERSSDSELVDWREITRVTLVVLERADELERELNAWYGGGADLEQARWGAELAHLLAERGLLERAAEMLEALQTLDELSHEDLRALASWWTVLDQPERASQARIASWEVLGEGGISQRLQADLGRIDRRGNGSAEPLDPEVPERFVALMRKASRPQNHLWSLQRCYAATGDFRLLQCLPEGVLGHASQNVYPFLERVGATLDLIHEEATIDRLVTRLEELAAASASPVDRRGLDLLAFAALRRALDQASGTEGHLERALASLRRSERELWSPGEPGMMAAFLAAQGALASEALAGEQLRILRGLVNATEDVEERFEIQGHLAELLWAYDDKREALGVATRALRSLRVASSGVLPVLANGRLQRLARWHESLAEWRVAESLWAEELARVELSSQREWLTLRLLETYGNAVASGGETSLGRGASQYARVRALFLREFERRTNERTANQLVTGLCELFRRGRAVKAADSVGADLHAFAFTELPRVLDLYQHRGAQNMVQRVADCLAEILDQRTALSFYVVQAETEPRWLRLARQDFWQRHSRRFAGARAAAGELDEVLEARVLAIALRALRSDLGAATRRNRSMFDGRRPEFWTAQRARFLEAALEVLEQRRDSGLVVSHAAEYLFEGLSAFDEAITALQEAEGRGLLDLAGRRRLVEYLQRRKRWEESLAPVAALIVDQPAAADLRVHEMRAHHGLGRSDLARAALARARAALEELDAWVEGPIATLAAGCVRTELHEEAIELFDEAIALHVRNAPGRGIGDGVLSGYHREQSRAFAALGRLVQAVDAAAGAIVAWGGHVGERANDLSNLDRILREAEDLDGYVAHLDQQVAQSGLENPILRKSIGSAYLARSAFERAAAQLRLASEAQPDDAETGELLVRAYDQLGDKQRAANVMLRRARLLAHDLDAFTVLGARLVELQQGARAERAFTSLVEAMPNESEGHQRLAEVREGQGRWEEALWSWGQVLRTRSREPQGPLGMARALIELERDAEARELLRGMLAEDWPSRFGDVHGQASGMLRGL